MRKWVFIFLLFCCVQAQAQVHPVFKLLGHWDNDQLGSIGNETFSDMWGWSGADGREYAIIGSIDSTYFIEVTDATHPRIRAVKAGRASHCVHRDYQTCGHYCYAVAGEGNSSLQVFDLQYLPDSVHKVYDSDDICVTAHAIFIGDGRLYFCTHTMKDGNAYALSVASLSDPEKPVLISHLIPPTDPFTGALFNNVHEMFARGDTAWLSCQEKGLFIYDYRDSLQPKLIGSITPPYPQAGFNHSNWLSPNGNYLVFTDETKGKALKIYDVSALKAAPTNNFKFLSTFGYKNAQGSMAHDPFVRDTIVFISYYEEGVVAFSISDPAHPRFLAQYDTYPQNDINGSGYTMSGCWGLYPFLPSGHVLASDETNGLFILGLDTSSVNSIRQPLPNNPWWVENPVGEILKIHSYPSGSGKMAIELYDLCGRRVLSQEECAAEGVNSFSFALPAGVKAGVYVLQLRAGDQSKMVKLMKD